MSIEKKKKVKIYLEISDRFGAGSEEPFKDPPCITDQSGGVIGRSTGLVGDWRRMGWFLPLHFYSEVHRLAKDAQTFICQFDIDAIIKCQ